MRKRSVKVKITLWYLLLMGLMAGLMLVFLRLISGSVYTQSAMEQLDQTVRENLGQVTLVDGRPQMGEGFQFYENGVYTLVYSQDKTLLAGQVPVAFTAAEPFHNGLTRLVDTDTGQYYVLDFWVPAGWEEGLWVRGLLEVPAGAQSMPALLWVAAVSLPLFLLLAAVGGYWIARRAFRPLEHITATADASHELRTPVSVIKSACEYGETYGETLEEQRETLAMIHRQADKMSQLIDQLLRITRLDQGTELARRERVDLTALAREVCAEGPWPQDRLTLEGGEPVFAQVDRALIARLLQNLIDNGFKYGKPGGGVWVTLRRQGGEALLTVRDDGIGIAPDQQARVWQRFYQVDPVRGEKSGAGLGLSMVWKIAQAHGGHMSLESVPGQGSSFTLHLPAER